METPPRRSEVGAARSWEGLVVASQAVIGKLELCRILSACSYYLHDEVASHNLPK